MRNEDWDDGGTPMWRARHRIIDVQPEPRGFLDRWRGLTFGQQAILVLFLAFLAVALPAAVLVVGAAGMALGLWR